MIAYVGIYRPVRGVGQAGTRSLLLLGEPTHEEQDLAYRFARGFGGVGWVQYRCRGRERHRKGW